jgi:DNA invertase Pin-like site-specific DNA recombinase
MTYVRSPNGSGVAGYTGCMKQKRPKKMRAVAYYRCSTAEQGESRLGIEGQMEDVRRWSVSANATVIPKPLFIEIESGRDNDRPVLREALAFAKAHRATLVVAKLDRLSRKLHFVSGLMESGVDFRCCEFPNADKFEIHLRASFAEEEARKISERTRAALAARRARGLPLGAANPKCQNLTPESRLRGSYAAGKRNQELAQAGYDFVKPIILGMRRKGVTLQEIANHLNSEGIPTRRGKKWFPATVKIVLNRFPGDETTTAGTPDPNECPRGATTKPGKGE